MSKKNLDKLFHEKFKGFSEVPDEKVWEGIVTALEKKKKRRGILPFWWKLGGVAAVLAIALYVINPFSDIPNDIPVITNVEKQNASDSLRINDAQLVDEDNEESIEDAVVESESIRQEESETTNGAVQDPLNPTLENPKFDKSDPTRDTEVQKKTSVAENDSKNNILQKEAKDKKIDGNEVPNIKKEAVADTEKDERQNLLDKKLKGTTESTDTNTILQDKVKQSQEEGIAQLEEAAVEKEIDGSKKKSIFDEIKADEETDAFEVAANDGGKWSVGANVAPVYFSSLGEGSPIHSSFVPNSKSGDINLSYGLSVAYAINKKLSVRSGIHKVDYGYDTNDIEFSSSFEASANGQIQNIDYTVISENVFVSSKTSANALRENVSFDAATTEASRDGVIAQQFGYLEIPVELNYALTDNRFGVNLVGGVSSLFLVDNSVELSSGQLTTEIGKANNINSVNFSANAGFGVNYKFSPKVQLNVEPVFKYQLNTFSNDSGNFQPFSIGVYSGLSFKF